MGLRPTQRDGDAPVWGRLSTGGRLSIGPLANSWRMPTASSTERYYTSPFRRVHGSATNQLALVASMRSGEKHLLRSFSCNRYEDRAEALQGSRTSLRYETSESRGGHGCLWSVANQIIDALLQLVPFFRSQLFKLISKIPNSLNSCLRPAKGTPAFRAERRDCLHGLGIRHEPS
jgi:hypothetical protein